MRPPSEVAISQRGLLAGITASGALLLAGADATKALAAPGGAVARNPLYVPPTVGLGSAYNLTGRPGTVDLGGGSLSSAWVYNGTLPGPSFRARPRDNARPVPRHPAWRPRRCRTSARQRRSRVFVPFAGCVGQLGHFQPLRDGTTISTRDSRSTRPKRSYATVTASTSMTCPGSRSRRNTDFLERE
jgi:hypothetical protein